MLEDMERAQMRAGDGDRQQVAARLKQALDEGRLDLSEYDERLQKTYAAKTFGDLDGLLHDLPGTVPTQRSQVRAYQAPAAPASDPAAEPDRAHHPLAWLGPSFGIFVVCTVIYLISSAGSGDFGYFWPVWTLIPFVLGLLGTMSGGGSHGRDRDRRRDRRRYR
jgi:hypothetical protein